MKEEIKTPFNLLLFLKNKLQEEKQLLFFFFSKYIILVLALSTETPYI